MRINLGRKGQLKGLTEKITKELVRNFASEYDFPSMAGALSYICTGKQGLSSFVTYLKDSGYNAHIYYLDPNKDLFTDVGDAWAEVSRTSPSFGFIIADDDPKLVELKLRVS
jgi:hypothetical protein